MTKKRIVICASASFEKEIIDWKNKLGGLNYEVIKYPEKIGQNNFLKDYELEFSDHYKAIKNSNAIIALNLDKNSIAGYIGAGVFAEIAFAIGLNRTSDKKIEVYYVNPISNGKLPYSDELELWQKLQWIRQFKS